MIRLVSVPYHLGRARVGMGAGPDRLLAGGAARAVAGPEAEVTVDEVTLPGPFEHEIGSHFQLQGALANHVRKISAEGHFPIVLGGNCSSVLGVVAGLGAGHGGVVWFDAHADANTPETTSSGFLDGMPVAVLTGRCWRTMATSAIPGFAPVPDEHVVLAGVRSVDDNEQALLDTSQIGVVPAAGLSEGAAFGQLLRALSVRAGGVHVHVDLDVIDLDDGRANEFAAAGGPTLDALDGAIRQIGEYCKVNSVSLTSYNPSVDDDEGALRAGLRLLHTLGQLAPSGQ